MTDNRMSLFCLVDGEALSNAFSIKIPSNDTVDDLKNLIKTKKAPRFDGVAADELTLWRVSIPDDDDNGDDDLPILLDSIPGKDRKRLKATTKLSKVFIGELPEDTIHVVVHRPSQSRSDDLHPEVAALRKQLSDMKQLQEELLDPSISLSVVVKPEKKVAFTWSTFVDKATLDDLRKRIFDLYPQYADDEYLEIFFYNGQPIPERICDSDDLRKILKIAKTNSKTRLTISLETPTKTFSLWTFKDVISEYNLSESTDVGVEVLPPFTDIQAAPLDSPLEKRVLDQLIDEIRSRVDVLKLLGANEATKSMVVGSFLVAATKLFEEDLYLAAQRNLSGRRGNGPLDYSVHPRKTHSYTLGVTEVKKEDFRQGVAQNIVQLESALTAKKRKRGPSDVDGEEEPPMVMKSYGIVTDASQWLFLECTMREDETVSYRMTELERTLNYSGKWQDDARFVLERLVWLWSRMRDEIPARERYSRKASSPPSARKTNV
ncbi:hypothetical protein BG000_011618 [Podila horticola]|nr:hypothetical protein BG000_011618 [Podila horticola]